MSCHSWSCTLSQCLVTEWGPGQPGLILNVEVGGSACSGRVGA